MREIRTSGLMSGERKRSDAHRAQATAPLLDSTPYHCARYEYEGTEVYFSSVVSSGEAPEMLELVETAFDPVALFVDFEVIVDGLFLCHRAGDDGRGSELSDAFSDGIAVMGFVGQDILGAKAGHQVRCPWRVAGLAS